ncbi:ABC transporter substrate-binding protein [Burkholderia sp. Ac-20353]|uniref:ABC transporter substrate-binding protein n=1 Tax=Burkholderia sp. Ac-20353 TaxID=2703894 RepID=UPI0032173A7A|nr:ABC transporter substrate-binding protein [Burkholderia sp. Ac-20353]
MDFFNDQSVDARRRAMIRAAAGGAALATLPVRAWSALARQIRIGFVSPQTGPLAAFSEPDDFTIEQIRQALRAGIKVAGRTYPVEIIYKDSQSNSSRAADVTNELILNDKVDLVVAASTPATTNPVADQCELNGVPCITTDTPWQAHFFGRGGSPKKGFDWTYHFFWGLEDIVGTFTSMWAQIPTSKVVGALWPNDSDGNIWGDAQKGFPPILARKGFTLVDKGRFHLPSDNFSAYIADFKRRDAAIVTGVIPPPDFANFWSQAGQQGYRPKVVTVAKACEFPAVIQSFGERAAGLSVEVWWSPDHPFRSSLTGVNCQQLAQSYSQKTGHSWCMPLGFKHALFEVAIDALRRSADLTPEAIRNAIRETNLSTIVGQVNFRAGPIQNIAKTPLAGGQWKKRKKGFELTLVDNSQAPMIPIHDRLEPIPA